MKRLAFLLAGACAGALGCFEATIMTPDLLSGESKHIAFPDTLECESYLEEMDATFINAQLLLLCANQGSPQLTECVAVLDDAGTSCEPIWPTDDTQTRAAKREAGICHFLATDLAAVDIGLTNQQITELYECALPSHAFETLLTSEAFGGTLFNLGFELHDLIVSADLDEQAGDLIGAIEESSLTLQTVNHDDRDISLEMRFAFTDTTLTADTTFFDAPDPVAAVDDFWRSFGMMIEVPAQSESRVVFRGATVVAIVEAAFEAVPEGSDARIHMAFFNESAIYSTTDLEITEIRLFLAAGSDVLFPFSYLFY